MATRFRGYFHVIGRDSLTQRKALRKWPRGGRLRRFTVSNTNRGKETVNRNIRGKEVLMLTFKPARVLGYGKATGPAVSWAPAPGERLYTTERYNNWRLDLEDVVIFDNPPTLQELGVEVPPSKDQYIRGTATFQEPAANRVPWYQSVLQAAKAHANQLYGP